MSAAARPTYVRLELLATGSADAQQRCGGLPWLGQEVVVVGPGDRVRVGPPAFPMALWTTRRSRPWAHRLSGPTWAPMAERLFHAVSSVPGMSR